MTLGLHSRMKFWKGIAKRQRAVLKYGELRLAGLLFRKFAGNNSGQAGFASLQRARVVNVLEWDVV